MPRNSNRKKRRPRVACSNCDGEGVFSAIMVGGQAPTCALCGGEKTVSRELDVAYKLLCEEMPKHEAILHLFDTAPNLLSAQARIILWERLNAENKSSRHG